MNFYTVLSLKHCPVKVSSVAHKEKLTCISDDGSAYGGFHGGVYRITENATELVGRINPPVSFIMRAPVHRTDASNVDDMPSESICGNTKDAPNANGMASVENLKTSTEYSDENVLDTAEISKYKHKIENRCKCTQECKCSSLRSYVIGDWDGNVYIHGRKIKVSSGSYPIKHILCTRNGYIVHDMSRAYLVQDRVVNSVSTGTWPLHAISEQNRVITVTDYTVNYLSIRDGLLVDEGSKVELLRDVNHTETIISLDKKSDGVAGSIGGWILKLNSVAEPEHCAIEKIAKIADTKITGIAVYTFKGTKYYICTTQNEMLIVHAKSKKLIDSVRLCEDNGVFAVLCTDEKESIFIFNRNFKTFYVDISAVLLKNSTEKNEAQSVAAQENNRVDTYEDLLKELNAGLFD
ncbi:hypothetical protein NEMIN01_1821 [Nematocida minor]|uniref:uncharacterized protein n=1 Tax=Nematocida minor TaxID=1912983 RepID=UPI0022210C6D|nr:uncharacterized protein NEMIN01_1821 [Nematocida minor]KAI5192125.1 hypothetical protein NEMIN01_1821 [Nematocida minor]